MTTGERPRVREAVASDDAVLALLVPDVHRRRTRLRLAQSGTETLLVIESDNQVRGALSIRWTGGCDYPHPWLYGGEILPTHQRHGLGTTLWHAAHRICLSQGATHASLDVEVTNGGARRLYQRLGYTVVSRHDHHWVARDSTSDTIIATGTSDTWLMRLKLTSPARKTPQQHARPSTMSD